MQLNIHTTGNTFVTIHDELKGDTEAKAAITRRTPSQCRPEADLRWFSDITEGELATLVFADGFVFSFTVKSLYVSSGSSDPRHTCNGDRPVELQRYCPGCDRVR